MFSKSFFLTLFTLLAIVVSASAIVVPRRQPPKDWAFGYLEDYQTYHTRYLAISCQDHHGEPFFDECCHPLLATETLEKNRPSWCAPSAAASASASAAEPTSTVKTPEDDQDEDDDEDCDEYYDEDDTEDDERPSTPTKVAGAVAADPTTTPSEETTEEPKPTKTKTTPASEPTSDADSSPEGNSQTFTGGFATFFYQNGVAGACGKVHQDSDLIAAIDGRRYGNLNAKSSLCGKQVKITNPKSKKSVTVTVVDACPTCENNNSIDLSLGAFKKIATLDEGMVGITWSFV